MDPLDLNNFSSESGDIREPLCGKRVGGDLLPIFPKKWAGWAKLAGGVKNPARAEFKYWATSGLSHPLCRNP